MLQDLLNFAHELAWEAGKLTQRYYQTALTVEHKADESPVTVADKTSEAFLRAAIQARFPEHGILGEEEGYSGPAGAEFQWVLDPIDGTKTFVRGAPMYGVMIGILRAEQPVVGVVNMPALNEIVYAASGLGCYWNGRRCRTSSVSRFSEGLVCATYARGYEQYGKAEPFARLLESCGMFRTWGDCYGYVMVATGRAEVALDPILSKWDAAPLLPILTEAGGTFTDWRGNATIDGAEGLATNGALFDEVMSLVRT